MKRLLSIALLLSGLLCIAQSKKYKILSVAFYNLENLYDTINDPHTNDNDFLPEGKKAWTQKRYNQKLKNLSQVISQMSIGKTGEMPTVIGVAEIENKTVLEDLVNTPLLKSANYGIVHIDSPDKRGIDVAFLYQKKYFEPENIKAYPLYIFEENKQRKQKRIFTRDQLVISGNLDGEKMHFIVGHWPARLGGKEKSEKKRIEAAKLNRKIVDSLYNLDPNAKIFSMGDFNDTPSDESVHKYLNAKTNINEVKPLDLFNTMHREEAEKRGTLNYRNQWFVFDHIIISQPLLKQHNDAYRYWKTEVFRPNFIKQKGVPFRNKSDGEPGYSDHFPVVLYLIKTTKN